MFMRPVKDGSHPRTRGATAKYEPVWVTCDELAAEGILVSAWKCVPQHPSAALLVKRSQGTVPSYAAILSAVCDPFCRLGVIYEMQKQIVD